MVRNIVKGKEVDISTYKVITKKGAKNWYLVITQKEMPKGIRDNRKGH